MKLTIRITRLNKMQMKLVKRRRPWRKILRAANGSKKKKKKKRRKQFEKSEIAESQLEPGAESCAESARKPASSDGDRGSVTSGDETDEYDDDDDVYRDHSDNVADISDNLSRTVKRMKNKRTKSYFELLRAQYNSLYSQTSSIQSRESHSATKSTNVTEEPKNKSHPSLRPAPPIFSATAAARSPSRCVSTSRASSPKSSSPPPPPPTEPIQEKSQVQASEVDAEADADDDVIIEDEDTSIVAPIDVAGSPSTASLPPSRSGVRSRKIPAKLMNYEHKVKPSLPREGVASQLSECVVLLDKCQMGAAARKEDVVKVEVREDEDTNGTIDTTDDSEDPNASKNVTATDKIEALKKKLALIRAKIFDI